MAYKLHRLYKKAKDNSDSTNDLMAISGDDVIGVSSRKTIRFQCHIQKQKALALVDFGSSHSFLSEQFVALLPNCSLLKKPVTVRVADGGTILCTHEIVDYTQMVQ